MPQLLRSQSAESIVYKLERRQSYLAKAPHQPRSRKRALSDAALKLSPASWLGPVIIKAHERYEYRKARKYTEGLHADYQEKRRSSSTRENSLSSLMVALDTAPAPIEFNPGMVGEEEDPWKLPPIEEIH